MNRGLRAIKLTQQTGMATGVGVRMLFDDNIATFDQYVTTKSEAAANQTLDIPFQVRYQQISNEVTPACQYRCYYHSGL
jgi:type 1 fimbria pilin